MTDWTSLANQLLRDQDAIRDDRRAVHRVELPEPMRARLLTDRSGTRTVALVKDFSLAGMGFTVGVELQPGHYVIVELSRRNMHQKILARIAHCRRVEAGLYQAGAEFYDETLTSEKELPVPQAWLDALAS